MFIFTAFFLMVLGTGFTSSITQNQLSTTAPTKVEDAEGVVCLDGLPSSQALPSSEQQITATARSVQSRGHRLLCSALARLLSYIKSPPADYQHRSIVGGRKSVRLGGTWGAALLLGAVLAGAALLAALSALAGKAVMASLIALALSLVSVTRATLDRHADSTVYEIVAQPYRHQHHSSEDHRHYSDVYQPHHLDLTSRLSAMHKPNAL